MRQFEASWTTNIMAGRTLWVENECPPNERKNAVIKNLKRQVNLSNDFRVARCRDVGQLLVKHRYLYI